MDSSKDGKRKKDKHSDDDERRREKKSKRVRSRSRSPAETRESDSRRKRRHSKSRSPITSVKQEKRANAQKDPENKKDAPERRARETDMLNTRTGGAYIPPARLRMMQAQITDKSSVAYQRLAWEALKKSIHGHINKINVGNIGIIIKQLLQENIVRGRGLLCRSVIQAQAASPTFTNVYAALVAAVNSRFPNIGELLLKRLVIQFKRGFKRNDKAVCISSVSFVAHLINQRVAHEILALELLTLLVESPSDDSVEVAIAFLKECGQKLTEVSSKGVNAIFEMLRNILHEGQLDKRVQYMIEVMFQVWKDGFKDHPALIEELELVPEEEQFTHLLMLDDATDPQDILNVFKFDEKYEENEQKYKTLSNEILGSDAESGEEDGSGESGSAESDEEEEAQKEVTIIDNTETNLVALRRTIYLTINSSLDFEECAHKLMKMQLKPGQEVELCHMFLDCCAEQRTYEKFYGLLAQRFCNINRIYIGPFEEIFKDSYGTAHRLDTNRLRNVSKFFAHLLFTDSISWEVMECVRLNEEDTTSSSRIYIKILFQELAEYMGLKKLNDRLKDPTLQGAFSGVFPRDNPKNTRFSINFFTSIGLGGLTDELRDHLKQMPKNVPPLITEITVDSESSSDSSSDSSSSDDSSSSSDSSGDPDGEKSKKKKDKTKSKKDKSKDKTPKTPEDEPAKDTERWGHDGFYDTYGKDARRTEARPDRPRDGDNFARPRDVRGPNGRSDQRNEEDWRNRRNDRYEQDEFRRPDRNGSDNRRYRDDESSKRSDDRNERGDDRRQRSDGNDDHDRRHDKEDRNRGNRNRDDFRSNQDKSGSRLNRDRDISRSHGDKDDSIRDRNNSNSSREKGDSKLNREKDESRSDQDRDESRSHREKDVSRSNRGREDFRPYQDKEDSRSNQDRDDSRSNRDKGNSKSFRGRENSGSNYEREDTRPNQDKGDSKTNDNKRDRDGSRPNRERDDSRSIRETADSGSNRERMDLKSKKDRDDFISIRDGNDSRLNRDKDDSRSNRDKDYSKLNREKDHSRSDRERGDDNSNENRNASRSNRDKDDFRSNRDNDDFRSNRDRDDIYPRGSRQNRDRDDSKPNREQEDFNQNSNDSRSTRDNSRTKKRYDDERCNVEDKRRDNQKNREDIGEDGRPDAKSTRDEIRRRENYAEETSKRRDAEDRRDKEGKKKKSSTEDDYEKSGRKDREYESHKKRKESSSDEDRSRRKDKDAVRRKERRDSSSDGSEESERQVSGRYWDVLDIKSKREVLEEVKARERRARS